MTNFSDFSNQMADAVAAASNSVVSVRAERPISGTVVAPGQVLTTAHVLHAEDVTVVTPGGQELAATVAGRDSGSDLALLTVPGLDLPPLGASAGVRVGELLLAVGRPADGVQATLGFMERELASYRRGWLHSGAAPFRGVSGGALLDARGGLVGVLNAGVMRGQLLAVPAERALKVAGLLGTTGRVPRGYLGIATQPVHLPAEGSAATAEDREERRGRGGRGRGPWGRGGAGRWGQPGGRWGLTVVQVESGSPAAQAGLKVGDILLGLGGRALTHPRELLGVIREHAGQTVTARLLRGGEEHDLSVTIGER